MRVKKYKITITFFFLSYYPLITLSRQHWTTADVFSFSSRK